MKMEQTEGSETLEYKIQTPGNYPVESLQYISFIAPVIPTAPTVRAYSP
jgi:hypothetical protein